jgi:UDP-N-acetylmuramoylalanine--D-glutamate ligase
MSHFIRGLGDPIGIIGMGLSGKAVKDLLHFVAPEKKIITYDAKPSEADSSDLKEMLLKNQCKTLVVSPGVPLTTPLLLKERERGTFITSELSVAHSCLTSEKIIAVTGAVGKSTTTALLVEAAKTVDPHSVAVGNIGKPLAEYVLEVVQKKRSKAAWLCLELSSFQLENFDNLSAATSLITYFTANHMERYVDLGEYYETKWTLIEKTKGSVFINSDSEELLSFSKLHSDPKIVLSSYLNPKLEKYDLRKAQLLGSHNQQNLALVALVIETLNWGPAAIDAIKNFTGLPHRLENVGTFKGIRFVNDSKATALDSVYSAIESLHLEVKATTQFYVLLGGKDKNLPWPWLSQIKDFLNIRPIYFGECAEKAQKSLNIPGPCYSRLESALQSTFPILKSGDILLLSPGGTSYDEFKNFEERGDFFKKQVLSQFS